MQMLELLRWAGWTVTEQVQDRWRIERGDWVIEVVGKWPAATLTHIADWAAHGFEVACTAGVHVWPDEKLRELMALPLGSTTVGVFCGVEF